MDPNTSIERLRLGEDNRISLDDGVESNGEWDTPEFHDTSDSGKKKEAKAFTFYRMGTEDISERYDAPCFINGLEAYDGEINLEHDKNLVSNEFMVNLCLEHEMKNGDKVVKKELISSRNKKKSSKNYKMKYDDEGPSLTINHALTREEISREELEKDLWERIVILNEPRPIIETLKYGDQYKKVLDTILLEKLKLDSELELEEVEANEEMIREYKAIK
ncbi:hypothetical protein Tco_0609471 [Tanacetum coccineum]